MLQQQCKKQYQQEYQQEVTILFRKYIEDEWNLEDKEYLKLSYIVYQQCNSQFNELECHPKNLQQYKEHCQQKNSTRISYG